MHETIGYLPSLTIRTAPNLILPCLKLILFLLKSRFLLLLALGRVVSDCFSDVQSKYFRIFHLSIDMVPCEYTGQDLRSL